jgi:hypothetical protein
MFLPSLKNFALPWKKVFGCPWEACLNSLYILLDWLQECGASLSLLKGLKSWWTFQIQSWGEQTFRLLREKMQNEEETIERNGFVFQSNFFEIKQKKSIFCTFIRFVLQWWWVYLPQTESHHLKLASNK